MRPDEKGERPDQVRSNASPGPPLMNLLPSLADVAALQGPQAAVQRPLMVERQAAAKVRAVDERDIEAALRGVVGREQPVLSPDHAQHVQSPGSKDRER